MKFSKDEREIMDEVIQTSIQGILADILL